MRQTIEKVRLKTMKIHTIINGSDSAFIWNVNVSIKAIVNALRAFNVNIQVKKKILTGNASFHSLT